MNSLESNGHEAENVSTKKFTVVGSGVIGLLTAHELADRGHSVKVISSEGKPDEAAGSASVIAVGQFLPWVPAEHAEKLLAGIEGGLDRVVAHGREFYESLAENSHETGVMRVHNVELVGGSEWPEGLPDVMEVVERDLDTAIELVGADGEKASFTKELTFDTFSINTRKTVTWLAESAEAKGVVFEEGHLTREELTALDGIVINATGAGAKEITGATDIEHFKGHTILIKPGEGRQQLKEGVSVEDIIIMPREDGTVIAGALYRENPERPVPAQDEAEELFARLRELAEKTSSLVEGLGPELFTEGEVLLHSAGYRVELSGGGIRVAPDEEVEGLLHAYGFGGIGWSVGSAFAKRIANNAVSMHDEANREL